MVQIVARESVAASETAYLRKLTESFPEQLAGADGVGVGGWTVYGALGGGSR